MPSRQSHRGQHPDDGRLFSPDWIPVLREAVADLSFLFTRGYSGTAALKLVGDHFQLATRQRRAVLGSACSDESLTRRIARHAGSARLQGETLAVDGYNLLIAVESALSGAVLLRGRDGCLRDLASIHGSYRKVRETVPALRLIGQMAAALGVSAIQWYFDAPVSNSGRLKTLLLEEAAAHGWDWRVDLTDKTDQVVSESQHVIVTSDSWILDRAERWTNFASHIAARMDPSPPIVDMSPSVIPGTPY